MSQERDDAGRFAPCVSDEGVLEVFDAVDGPVVTSADVADRTGCSRRAARRALKRLYDEDRLARRRVAGRLLYWRRDVTSSTIDPDDPIWEPTTFSSGTTDTSERVDELLYGRSSET